LCLLRRVVSQQVAHKLVTSPSLWGSYGETCVMDLGHNQPPRSTQPSILAFHPSGIGKPSTGLIAYSYGGVRSSWKCDDISKVRLRQYLLVSTVGWQVTLCDLIWQVTPRGCEMGFH